MSNGTTPKLLFWIGPSKRDLKEFSRPVQRKCGFALRHAQMGSKHPDAKPLKGFRGAGVLEIVEDYQGSTYRAKTGIKTPKHEIELIERRLEIAEEQYAEWISEQEKDKEAPGS